MKALIKAEFLKLRRNNLWIIIVIFGLLLSSIPIGRTIFLQENDWLNFIIWSHAFTPFFLTIFISIFLYLIISNEFSSSTWKLILTEPINRGKLLLSKWLITNLLIFSTLLINAIVIGISAHILHIDNIIHIELIVYILGIFFSIQALLSILITFSIYFSNGNPLIGIGIVCSLLYLMYSTTKWLPTSFPSYIIKSDGYDLSQTTVVCLISTFIAGIIMFINTKLFQKREI